MIREAADLTALALHIFGNSQCLVDLGNFFLEFVLVAVF